MQEPPRQQRRGVCEGVRGLWAEQSRGPCPPTSTQARGSLSGHKSGHPNCWVIPERQLETVSAPLLGWRLGGACKCRPLGPLKHPVRTTSPNVPPKTTRARSKGHQRAGCLRGSELTEGRRQAPLSTLPARRGHRPLLSPHTRSSSWHLLGRAGRSLPLQGSGQHHVASRLEPMSQLTPAYPSLEGGGRRHTKAE